MTSATDCRKSAILKLSWLSGVLLSTWTWARTQAMHLSSTRGRWERPGLALAQCDKQVSNKDWTSSNRYCSMMFHVFRDPAIVWASTTEKSQALLLLWQGSTESSGAAFGWLVSILITVSNVECVPTVRTLSALHSTAASQGTKAKQLESGKTWKAAWYGYGLWVKTLVPWWTQG